MQIEDFRDMGHLLGRSRNLGQQSGNIPFDYAHGKTTKGDDWSAARIMQVNHIYILLHVYIIKC